VIARLDGAPVSQSQDVRGRTENKKRISAVSHTRIRGLDDYVSILDRFWHDRLRADVYGFCDGCHLVGRDVYLPSFRILMSAATVRETFVFGRISRGQASYLKLGKHEFPISDSRNLEDARDVA